MCGSTAGSSPEAGSGSTLHGAPHPPGCLAKPAGQRSTDGEKNDIFDLVAASRDQPFKNLPENQKQLAQEEGGHQEARHRRPRDAGKGTEADGLHL